MIQVLVMIFYKSYIFLFRTSKNNSQNSKSITIPFWILILILFPKIILGITPGKWSHIDKYIFGNNLNGPVKEIVKNANGKVVYSALYEYNSSGKLIKESYLNADGKADGSTIFQYKDGKVTREELFDKDHILLETKTFRYNPKGEIDLVEVFDKDNKLLLRSNINSWDKDFVKSGQTNWSDSKEIEIFNLIQDEKTQKHLFRIFITKKKTDRFHQI